jgi:uncharacterized protein YdgA (DUF945 family)
MVKRISIAVIAALVLLYPLATWLLGFAIEKRYDAAIGEMHEKAPYLTMTEHHFRRGWYTSQDEMTLEFSRGALGALPGAASSPAPFLITIHTAFHHGPICGWTCLGLARADSRVEFGEPLKSAIAGLFGSKEPFGIRSRLGFFGGGSAVVSSPAIEDTALHDGAHVGWGGLDADLSYGAGMASYVMHGTAPRAMFSAVDGKRVEVTAAAFDNRSKRVLRTLYEGDSTLTLGRVAFAGAGGAGAVTVDNPRLEASSRADGGFMTVSVKTSTGAITSAPLTLTGEHFDLTFRHLQIEALEGFTAGMQQANADSTLAPAARAAQALSVMKRQGAALLAQQPELAIDQISFANAKGTALLKGLVRLRDVSSADFADGADARVLLAKLDMDLDLTLDDALLQTLPGGSNGEKQLQLLADQGLITHDNGRFHTAILFRHGQMTFNGKPFQPGIAAPVSPSPSPPRPPPRATRP